MTFDLPPVRESTASKLRELEESAPNPVPKAIKAAMVQAAQELEAWAQLADTVAAELESVAEVKVSAMASASRVEEIQRQFKGRLYEAARRLRAMP